MINNNRQRAILFISNSAVFYAKRIMNATIFPGRIFAHFAQVRLVIQSDERQSSLVELTFAYLGSSNLSPFSISIFVPAFISAMFFSSLVSGGI